IKATDDTLAGLEAAGQDSSIHLKERTYSLGLAYDLIPKQLTLFANYGQGFRPPSMEYQYFSNAGRIAGVPISTSPCPVAASCDDEYKAQRSENSEAGVNYFNSNLFNSDQPNNRVQLNSKATFFHIHTSNLINSAVLAANPASVASQDGKEVRNGWEFENSLYYNNFYARAGYSRIAGRVTLPTQAFPLYTVPGRTFNLTLGTRIGDEWDVYFSYRKVSERQVLDS
ncbi:MAG: TonB-dependent receptor, partial [Pseudomonadota bacterium]